MSISGVQNQTASILRRMPECFVAACYKNVLGNFHVVSHSRREEGEALLPGFYTGGVLDTVKLLSPGQVAGELVVF